MICPGFTQPPPPRPRRRLVCTSLGSSVSLPPSVRVVSGPWRPVVVNGGKS